MALDGNRLKRCAAMFNASTQLLFGSLARLGSEMNSSSDVHVPTCIGWFRECHCVKCIRKSCWYVFQTRNLWLIGAAELSVER
uniref:Uncharacterized protein n=1 Tax=Noccaea caerulescens TaxID=107243 RepID=A0A1J3ETU2_NOCCA